MSNHANAKALAEPASLTVSQLARRSGVSVRALHHYDEIGLFCAHTRSSAGYRLSTHDDVERLQQILFFRELGFPLEEIRRIVSDVTFDVGAALIYAASALGRQDRSSSSNPRGGGPRRRAQPRSTYAGAAWQANAARQASAAKQ